MKPHGSQNPPPPPSQKNAVIRLEVQKFMLIADLALSMPCQPISVPESLVLSFGWAKRRPLEQYSYGNEHHGGVNELLPSKVRTHFPHSGVRYVSYIMERLTLALLILFLRNPTIKK